MSDILMQLQNEITLLKNKFERLESNIPEYSMKAGIGVKRGSSQLISNITWQTVEFSDIVWEIIPSGYSSQFAIGTPGRLTCRMSGVYVISASIRFATNTTGIRGMTIQETTVSEGGQVLLPASSLDTQLSHTIVRECAVNDYFQVLVYQSSGSGLNINYGSNGIIFSIMKVG